MKIISPHPLLIKEFEEKTKKFFYMYNSPQFLEFASLYLDQKVSKDSIDELRSMKDPSTNEPIEPTYLSAIVNTISGVSAKLLNNEEYNEIIKLRAKRLELRRDLKRIDSMIDDIDFRMDKSSEPMEI